jgi:hypothetical protein
VPAGAVVYGVPARIRSGEVLTAEKDEE